jgi:SAM-dependent methyltransferase
MGELQTELGSQGVPQARFVSRDACISCGSIDLKQLSHGKFHSEPLRSFIAGDPFGEDPMPHLRDAEWCLVQCQNCSQKYHLNIFDSEWNDIHYNKWITSESIEEFLRMQGERKAQDDFGKGIHSVERVLQIDRLTKQLRRHEPVKILDFGCGEGLFLAVCANFGFECYGVEFSSAREKTKRCEFFNNLEELAINAAPASFHSIVLFEVLEHLPNPLEVLQQLRPLLMTGGILILETPDCSNVRSINTAIDYRLIGPFGHINAFTPATLTQIAERSGFQRIKPGPVQCAAEPKRIFKREARRLLSPILPDSTQQYFMAV